MKCEKCRSPIIYDFTILNMLGYKDYSQNNPDEYHTPSLSIFKECCSNSGCKDFSGAVASDEKKYNDMPMTDKLRVRLSIHSETGVVNRIITNLPKEQEELTEVENG